MIVNTVGDSKKGFVATSESCTQRGCGADPAASVGDLAMTLMRDKHECPAMEHIFVNGVEVK